MKTVGHDVVQIFYKDDIYPQLDFNHNSNQLDELVADNIKKLLQDSHFHVGLQLNEQVCSLFVSITSGITIDHMLGPY